LESRRRLRRRTWLGGIGIGAAGIGAGLIYNAAPMFWRQYAREIGEPIHPAPHVPDPGRWPDAGLHAAWLGHSTVLLKIDGFTLITDPVLSTRVGIGFGPFTLGLKRLVEPALHIEQLPKLDLILLSHAHMDHFDLPTLRALEDKSTPVITASNTSDLFRVNRYARVQEIGWGQQTEVGPLTIHAFEVNHWGARMRTDTWRGYNGYVISAGRRRILFAGDTALTDTFRTAGGADLALMPIGAYNPWIRVHCSPEQAWRMANDARAEFVLPLHHQTFHLSHEPVHEPLERLFAAAKNADRRIALRSIGEEFHLT
jgi:L-ascorbate metabolism protein UlaG (beta-lactamase superfamily)